MVGLVLQTCSSIAICTEGRAEEHWILWAAWRKGKRIGGLTRNGSVGRGEKGYVPRPDMKGSCFKDQTNKIEKPCHANRGKKL